MDLHSIDLDTLPATRQQLVVVMAGCAGLPVLVEAACMVTQGG
jgi:hypothetical protein